MYEWTMIAAKLTNIYDLHQMILNTLEKKEVDNT